jgi:hypothetical protein
MDLDKSFALGVAKTYWKSTDLKKVNDLRTALGIKTIHSLPEGKYDEEALAVLKKIDFGKLGDFYIITAARTLVEGDDTIETVSIELLGE